MNFVNFKCTLIQKCLDISFQCTYKSPSHSRSQKYYSDLIFLFSFLQVTRPFHTLAHIQGGTPGE